MSSFHGIDRLRVTSVLPAPISWCRNIFHLLCALPLPICADLLLSKFFIYSNSLYYYSLYYSLYYSNSKLLAMALFPLLHLPGADTNPRTAAGLCSSFSQKGIGHSLCLFFPRQVFKCVCVHFQDVTFCIV